MAGSCIYLVPAAIPRLPGKQPLRTGRPIAIVDSANGPGGTGAWPASTTIAAGAGQCGARSCCDPVSPLEDQMGEETSRLPPRRAPAP